MGVWGILLGENILANLQTAWLPAIIILSLSPLTAAINHRRTETCQLQPAGYHNTLLKEAARKQANIHAWRRCFYRDGSASDPRLILSVSCVLYIQGRDQYVAPHVMVCVRTVVQWLWERYCEVIVKTNAALEDSGDTPEGMSWVEGSGLCLVFCWNPTSFDLEQRIPQLGDSGLFIPASAFFSIFASLNRVNSIYLIWQHQIKHVVEWLSRLTVNQWNSFSCWIQCLLKHLIYPKLLVLAYPCLFWSVYIRKHIILYSIGINPKMPLNCLKGKGSRGNAEKKKEKERHKDIMTARALGLGLG